MTFGYWLNNSILPIIENIKNWIIQVSNFLINNWIFKIIIYWELIILIIIIIRFLIQLLLYKNFKKEKDKEK